MRNFILILSYKKTNYTIISTPHSIVTFYYFLMFCSSENHAMRYNELSIHILASDTLVS